MPHYFCECCNISTKIKTHFNRHLKTTKHKNNVKKIADESEKSIFLTTNDHKMVKKYMDLTTNDHSVVKSEPHHKCEFCDKILSTKGHLARHIKNYCKQNIDNDYKKILDEQKTIFEEERNHLHKQIEKLLDKVGNTTINNQTNNIQLNSYGKEDLSHITDALKTKFLRMPYGMIPKMIEAIHFNDRKPENNNISITNIRDNKIKIFSGDKWVYKNKDETINDLVDGKYFILDNHYQENLNLLTEFNQTNYENFRNNYDEGDKKFLEQLKTECELVLLNNR
jgi:hypothetical protein